LLITGRRPHPNYQLYQFFEDKHDTAENRQKARAQHELNLTNAGKPRLAFAGESNGRKIKRQRK
jgi:hypothetical protein